MNADAWTGNTYKVFCTLRSVKAPESHNHLPPALSNGAWAGRPASQLLRGFLELRPRATKSNDTIYGSLDV